MVIEEARKKVLNFWNNNTKGCREPFWGRFESFDYATLLVYGHKNPSGMVPGESVLAGYQRGGAKTRLTDFRK